MKHIGIAVLGVALIASLIPVTSYAQTTTNESMTAARCATAQAKIATRLTALSTLQTERTTKYNSMTNRINAVITSSTEAKYPNVSKLTTARDTTTKAISDFTTQATVYRTALEKAQSTPCGDNGGQFVTALTTARKELTTLRADSIAVRKAVTQQAVPAIRDYAKWLKTNTADVKENS